MKRRAVLIGVLMAALTGWPLVGAALAQGNQIFIPLLVYRTGAYAPSGIPNANGFNDYFNLLNERDGGINGVKLVIEECETQYDTKLGVECYERLKGRAVLVNPYSTGITYQLIPKAPVDKVVVHSMGYGMTAAADGRWFPWVFNFPMTYWSQASAFVKYVAAQEGGMDKLKGKKIIHVFHNSPYGKEANPTLETLARQLGFELTLLAVDHPGQEQKATWLQVRRINPDWIYLSGWGVMNQVAVKEAAAINYKMDRLVGNWWSGSESDVVAAGDGAKGYRSMTFHATGAGFPVHRDILKHVYDKGKGITKKELMGEVYYNRGMINAMLNTEAIRTAMGKFGNKPLTGEQVRWGFENLNLTEQRLEQLGMKGMVRPLRVSCENHEGNGMAAVQQWDGKTWTMVSDWIYLSGWGVMNQVAVKEAAAINYKMDRLVGNWWSGSESDVVAAGDGAKGYRSMTFHATGAGFPVHRDILKHVYDKGKGITKKELMGEVYYNRGMINAMLNTEAIRTAMGKFGNKPLTGEQVRWGFENLNLTEQRLEQLGMKGMVRPLRVSCENHEGNGMAAVQQWDGKTWTMVSDWIEPIREVVRPKLEEAAVQEGQKLGYTKRDCAKEN